MAEGEGSRRATHVEGQNVPEVGEEVSFVQPPVQPPMQPTEDVLNQPGIPDLRVPDFTDGDPITADYWLNDLRIMLEGLHRDDQRKLEGAVSLLKGQARILWTNVTTHPREEITWEFFLREFRNKYIGDMFVREMRNAFLNLKQGDRTIYEYECEFNRLSRFASELIPTEREHIACFIEGLDVGYKEVLVAMDITNIQEAVN
ncbi:hypothetical protein V6N13_133752 [Hibiscus sabdariffa]